MSPLKKIGLSTGILLAASGLKRALQSKINLRNKVVLITGSRGLGLALAYEFGQRGARFALCARDAEELRRACDGLSREGIEAVPFPCDVTNRSEIEPLIESVVQRFGRLDILVNNAREIQVGPVQALQRSDFEHAMNLMFWAPVDLTFAALPQMKKQGGGHIINITSIGGRVSVPHLLPYSCAKFALVGFSTGLATELSSCGIRVLTVVPGLMRTGSYLKAKFKGAAKQEFAWFGLLGNLPGFSVSAGYAAGCIRRALETGRHVCTVSLPAKILIACEALIPDTMRSVLAGANRVLLPEGNSAGRPVEGNSLDPLFGQPFHVFTSLGKRAAHALNEQPS